MLWFICTAWQRNRWKINRSKIIQSQTKRWEGNNSNFIHKHAVTRNAHDTLKWTIYFRADILIFYIDTIQSICRLSPRLSTLTIRSLRFKRSVRFIRSVRFQLLSNETGFIKRNLNIYKIIDDFRRKYDICFECRAFIFRFYFQLNTMTNKWILFPTKSSKVDSIGPKSLFIRLLF